MTRLLEGLIVSGLGLLIGFTTVVYFGLFVKWHVLTPARAAVMLSYIVFLIVVTADTAQNFTEAFTWRSIVYPVGILLGLVGVAWILYDTMADRRRLQVPGPDRRRATDHS